MNNDQIFKLSKLFKNECIKNEVEEFINGYIVKNISFNDGKY